MLRHLLTDVLNASQVVTNTIAVSTTICPVTATDVVEAIELTLEVIADDSELVVDALKLL